MEQLVHLKSLDPNFFDLPDEARNGKKKFEPYFCSCRFKLSLKFSLSYFGVDKLPHQVILPGRSEWWAKQDTSFATSLAGLCVTIQSDSFVVARAIPRLTGRAFYINSMENYMERLAEFNKHWGFNFQVVLRWFESGYPLRYRQLPQVNKKDPPGLTLGWGKFQDSLSAWGPHVHSVETPWPWQLYNSNQSMWNSMVCTLWF